jgi:hypothetical protein
MTRRAFSAALTGAVVVPSCAAGDHSRIVMLTAIAGARLPARLAITTAAPDKLREGLWELRTYTGAPAFADRCASIFPRAGIRPVLWKIAGDDFTCLIPFEDLTTRDRAWTRLNADPQWTSARPRFQSYRFGLYRVV